MHNLSYYSSSKKIHLAASFRYKNINGGKRVKEVVPPKMLVRNRWLRTALFDAFLSENPLAILSLFRRIIVSCFIVSFFIICNLQLTIYKFRHNHHVRSASTPRGEFILYLIPDTSIRKLSVVNCKCIIMPLFFPDSRLFLVSGENFRIVWQYIQLFAYASFKSFKIPAF